MKHINKYICRLNGIICNSKQRWNKDKCRCECKELIDKGVCGKGFIWNPSNCECECNKSCYIGKYLDYSNCKCKKKLVDLFIEESTENIDETKIFNITLAENQNSYYGCNSYKVYIVFIAVVFTILAGITIYFVYYKWSLIRGNISCTKFNTHKETEIW